MGNISGQPSPAVPPQLQPPPAPASAPISLDSVTNSGAGFTFRERTISVRREDARNGIAYLIVGCFVLTILGSFVAFIFRGDSTVDDILKIVQAVISPVVGIVGAVTGFYFSSNAAPATKDKPDDV